MAPIMDIPNEKDYEKMAKIAEAIGVKYTTPTEESNKPQPISQIAELDRKNWIVVPEIKDGKFIKDSYSFEMSPKRISYDASVEKVGKELEINYKNTGKDSLGREFVGNNNWRESLMLNQGLGVKTPNMKQEIDYLHLLYLGSQDKIKVYDTSGKQVDSKLCEKLLMDTIKKQSPWRAEWIDTDYKTNGEDLESRSGHIFDKKGNIINYDSEILHEDTLKKNKQIDVIDFITKNHTKQGHISKDVKSGSFYFWKPGSDNNSVARFNANAGRASVNCYWVPSGGGPSLGVRAAKLRE